MSFGIMPDKSGFVWWHRFLDVVLPLGVLFCINYLFSISWHDRYLIMGVLGGLSFVLFAQMVGVYTSWRCRSLVTSFKLVLLAWIVSWSLLIVIAFLYKDASNFSRDSISTWALVVPFVLILYRALLRKLLTWLRSDGKYIKKIAIVGAGELGISLASTINQNRWLGYQVVAFFDDNSKLKGSDVVGIPVVANAEEITEFISDYNYDEVYLCLPLRAEERIKFILNKLTDTTVVVKFVPDLFSFDLMHARWTDVRGIPVISVYDSPFSSGSAKILKRIEDVVLSIIILLSISPIMIMLALGVKFTSPGPVFYRQTRVGWNGEMFQMLKFRSMPVDTERNGVKWGGAENKTNTKFGRFIRETSLDELPQFINVLKGDMSIVGPRPERDVFVEKFRKEIPRYMQKHMVKAGITGWAQINGWRGDTSLIKRIEFDLHYINSWSLWLDLKIILLTLVKGFIGKNVK